MNTNYVGTPAEVKRLTKEILAAAAQVAEAPATYLRLLVGTTVAELGAKPPKSETRGRTPKLNPEEIQRQLAALNVVHERFYAAVVEAAEEDLPRGKDQAKELNRRTNFARSSVSTVRGYIKAGNDITRVVVSRATKRSLAVERAPRPPSTARMRNRVENRSKALVASLLELAEKDKAAAIGELELLMGQLTYEMMQLGGAPVREIAPESAPEGIVRAGQRLFVPVTETQVLRQQARPS